MCCADFCWMSIARTTLWLGLSQAACWSPWYLFPGKGRVLKERICALWPDSGPAAGQYFLHWVWKCFLFIERHRWCSENRVGNYAAVLLCVHQQMAASRRAWVGLCWVWASAVAAHRSHLQASQTLTATAAWWGRNKAGIQPTTLEDLGHPVVAIFISEEAVCCDTYFSSYLLVGFFSLSWHPESDINFARLVRLLRSLDLAKAFHSTPNWT